MWRDVTSTELGALGQFSMVQSKVMDLYAAIEPRTGSLLSGRTAETALSKTTHKITVRYRNDIKPSDWFVYGGERYNILYILDPYANHERLEVYCEAVSIE